jgi:hypothetical protein
MTDFKQSEDGYYFIFYIPVTVLYLGIIPINTQLDAQFLFYVFISILYIFRATLCSSSGESIVSILTDLHTKRSPTHSDIYRMLY